ncbi:MAG: hypothetical protein ACREER_05540, partial [Alphaproteobacteria bacterium]
EESTMTKIEAMAEFQAADDAWSAELGRQFGRESGDVRYQSRGKGDVGSALRALYDAFHAKRRVWESLRAI